MDKKNAMIGLGIGAGLMYLLDPDRGKRRRAIVRDKTTSLIGDAGDAADTTMRDVRNRTLGAVAEVRTLFASDSELTDAKLEARVRERLGRVLSHPGAVDVSARAADGHVTLTGDVLAGEVEKLMRAVSAVRGVEYVDNRLSVHEEADNVPALHGEPVQHRNVETAAFSGRTWPPATRLLVGSLGSVLTLFGAKRRGFTGSLAGTAGLGLIARAVTNRKMTRLMKPAGGREGITVDKTITIDAPVEQVFAFWDNVENFPRFMSHLEQVNNLGGGRSYWVAKGPGGVPVEWEAEQTSRVPNEMIAWKSVRGSAIDNAGTVTFRPMDDGRSQIIVKMSYKPPAGMLGHTVASLFGDDPKSAMDEDLARLKTLIEAEKRGADDEAAGEVLASEIS